MNTSQTRSNERPYSTEIFITFPEEVRSELESLKNEAFFGAPRGAEVIKSVMNEILQTYLLPIHEYTEVDSRIGIAHEIRKYH